MAEELISEPKIVVQGEDCDSLETNHDYLNRFRIFHELTTTDGSDKMLFYEVLCAHLHYPHQTLRVLLEYGEKGFYR